MKQTRRAVHQGDAQRKIPFTILQSDGATALDLTGLTLTARITKPSGATIDEPLVIDDAASGLASYTNADPAFFDEAGAWIWHVYTTNGVAVEWLIRETLDVLEVKELTP